MARGAWCRCRSLGVWIIHDTLFNEIRDSGWSIGGWTIGGWTIDKDKDWLTRWRLRCTWSRSGCPVLVRAMPAFVIVALAGLSAVGLGSWQRGCVLSTSVLKTRGSPLSRGIGIAGVALTIASMFGVVLAGDSDAWFLLFATLFLGVVAWGFELVVSCSESAHAGRWALGSAIVLGVSLTVAVVLVWAEVDPRGIAARRCRGDCSDSVESGNSVPAEDWPGWWCFSLLRSE